MNRIGRWRRTSHFFFFFFNFFNFFFLRLEKKSLQSAPKPQGRSGNRKHNYFFFFFFFFLFGLTPVNVFTSVRTAIYCLLYIARVYESAMPFASVPLCFPGQTLVVRIAVQGLICKMSHLLLREGQSCKIGFGWTNNKMRSVFWVM